MINYFIAVLWSGVLIGRILSNNFEIDPINLSLIYVCLILANINSGRRD